MPAGADAQAKGLSAHAQRVLVIPVRYADDTGDPPVSVDSLNRAFFSRANPRSVASYYEQVSGGRFIPKGSVTPWVRLPGTRLTYPNIINGNPAGGGGPEAMARDAVRLAAGLVDLTAFDDDGEDGLPGSGDDDGIIDLLVILHPDVGWEVDPVTEGPAILSIVSSALDDPEMVSVGVRADGFLVSSARGPLGVWVHEMGHLLGLDDLYDLDVTGPIQSNPNRGGLGLWSLMAHGTWGGGGAQPSNLDALSRQLLGWEDEVLRVFGAGDFILDAVEEGDSRSAEVLPLGPWGRERFVIENRRRRDGAVVDGDLPGSGILIYRVDDEQPVNRSPDPYWVEVLEADGRNDLRDAANNGDASDPFTGSGITGIDGGTTPSTSSRRPDTDKAAPSILVGSPDALGGQRVTIAMSSTPALRLQSALFEAGALDFRAFLRISDSLPWRLIFDDGGTTPTAVSATFSASDARIAVSPLSVDLVASGGTWIPDETVTVTVNGLVETLPAPEVTVTLTVDGVARTLVVGAPISVGPGLAGNDFSKWDPAMVGASGAATEFTLLGLAELPLPADNGWQTTTGGDPGYTAGAELTLTSPWFAPPDNGRVQLWSRQETEAGRAGLVWDGGVIEYLVPDRGWRALVPEGGPVAYVNHRSAAATRGLVGFGGPATDWQGYSAPLPTSNGPMRVRFRFGADETIQLGSWALAKAGTNPAPGTAALTLADGVFGEQLIEATFDGDLTRVTSVRFRYRRPLTDDWIAASDLFTLTPDLQRLVAELTLPTDADVLTIGLFGETSGGNVVPPLLLGTIGFRATRSPVVSLRARPNPSAADVFVQFASQDVPTELLVFDLRGRRVRSIAVPSRVSTAVWDGTDDAGGRMASGRYVIALANDPTVRISVVLLR